MIDAVLDAFATALKFLHDAFDSVPVLDVGAWGWAIIALTLVVRIALLPLAIKQTRSMRAMQALQPQLKELQKKYKVDRELMKKDPEQYKAKKQKLNEEMMALYQREGANPAASCLPLLAQAPIFIALFYTLRRTPELAGANFYFVTSFTSPDADPSGLAAVVSQAGWPGWLLILLMSGTMFFSQKQMMARTAAQGTENPMAQQQKILLYVMPVFLAVISFQFPLGILLYWVTTNFWQVAQQAIILREVKHEVETGEIADKPGGQAIRRGKGKASDGDQGPSRRISPGASSGNKPVRGSGDGSPTGGTSGAPPAASGKDDGRNGDSKDQGKDRVTGSPESGPRSGRRRKGGSAPDSPDAAPVKRPRKRDHLPRRGGAASH